LETNSYFVIMRLRGWLFALAWLAFLFGMIFEPGVYTQILFDTSPRLYPMWSVVLLAILFFSPSAIAHFYFLLSPLVLILPFNYRSANILRYLSVSLFFIWTDPILHYLYPSTSRIYKFQDGFYLVASAYMMVMLSLLIAPKRSPYRPGFPVGL
jgi:hypothetical protein